MLSKFLRTTYMYRSALSPPKISTSPRIYTAMITNVRQMTLIPPSQYDMPFPKRLKIGYTLRCYWEIIPLFLSTCFGLSLMFFAILWSFKHKVDVTYTTHNRDTISRTMNLRQPTVHKLITINQKYQPWPEMANALDRMKSAEKRAAARAQACKHP